MENYDFKLTPAYCLYNGVAVKCQKGSEIEFVVESDDEKLKFRLRKAFCTYLKYILRQKNCPEIYGRIPRITFSKGSRVQIKKLVSHLYSEKENSDENENQTLYGKNEKRKKEAEAAAVILLDTILDEARIMGATDIHIEDNFVKYRILGRLEKKMQLDYERCYELIQRLKYLAGMNVLGKGKSQDGHFVYGGKEPLYVRVSTMQVVPKIFGGIEESVVIRLLDTKKNPLKLEKLGFTKQQYEKIVKLAEEKSGLILVCGPTGAGKSTTAASILLEMEREKKGNLKIISLEDPPEYIIPGVTQIHINHENKNGFDEALTHIFRQDPDVLMIGEIRDENTAAVACRAALTGHLVIATMHTGSTGETILRLNDLGVPNKIISAVLKGVIIQEMKFLNNKANLIADVAVGKKEINKSDFLVPLFLDKDGAGSQRVRNVQ